VYFVYEISRDKNTPENPPTKDDLELHVGYLTKVEVFTRSGQAGTLRLRVMDELTQVAPSRAPEYFAGNGETHTWVGRYPLKKRERALQVWAWNTSTKYDRAMFVGLTVLEPEELDPLAFLKDFITSARRWMGLHV